MSKFDTSKSYEKYGPYDYTYTGTTTTVVRQWLYLDSLKPVAELDGSGNLTSTFAYAPNQIMPDFHGPRRQEPMN